MTNYREQLWASPGLYLATALVIPASLLVFLPINFIVGIIVAATLYVGCVVLLILASPVIEVSRTLLRAGRATLPLRFVGAVEGFQEPEATLERGRRLDARAWLMLRGWIKPVIKITITDPDDPTPYWLISTRNPAKLQKALVELAEH